MQVTEDWLLRIAAGAVRAVFPPERIGDVNVAFGATLDGQDAYEFEVHVDQVEDRDDAADMRMKLRGEFRDRLTAAGDETFPFVQVLDRAAVA